MITKAFRMLFCFRNSSSTQARFKILYAEYFMSTVQYCLHTVHIFMVTFT